MFEGLLSTIPEAEYMHLGLTGDDDTSFIHVDYRLLHPPVLNIFPPQLTVRQTSITELSQLEHVHILILEDLDQAVVLKDDNLSAVGRYGVELTLEAGADLLPGQPDYDLASPDVPDPEPGPPGRQGHYVGRGQHHLPGAPLAPLQDRHGTRLPQVHQSDRLSPHVDGQPVAGAEQPTPQIDWRVDKSRRPATVFVGTDERN